MESKGKFRAGQVVRVEEIPAYYARLVKRKGEPLFDADGNVYLYSDGDGWAHINDLRPLTAREAGPARGKRSTK